MPRKTEQEIELDEQIRFLKAEQRKCRTSSGRLKIADRLLKLYAMRFPSPIAEANAVAKATKLKIKADKLVSDQAKVESVRKPSEWLERPNPVEEHAARAAVRTKMREDRAEAEVSHTLEPLAPVEALPSKDAVEPQGVDQVPVVVQVSPEMQRITTEAETAAKRQSTGWGDLKRIMAPLEQREAWDVPVKHQPVILTESSGPGETYARLGSHVETQPEAPGEWETVTDGLTTVRRRVKE